MRRGLAAAAAGAVVALALAPLFAPAAEAQGALNVTSAPITMTPAPGPAGNVFTNNLAVSGHFHVDGGFSPTIDWVSVNLSWTGPAPNPPVPGPFTMCGTPPSGGPGPACGGNDFAFTNRPLAPGPTYNGPYRISATGKASDQLSGQSDQTSTPNTLDFNLTVPPPDVTAVTATVNKDHIITVSFDRDTTTPDLQSYWIYRKGPGDKDFVARYVVLQEKGGARLSAPDPSSRGLPGGDYLYQVEAHRNGGTGNSSSFVPSDRTHSQSPKLTVPPPPPGATTVPPAQPGPNGAPPVVKGTPSGVNRNSNFSGSSGGSSSATSPTSEAVTPDPGFVRGLPDAGSNPGADQNSEEGDNSAVAVTPGRHSSSGRGYLVPVAGAAVLVLGALHLRMFKKKLDEPPSNLTPVG